MAAIGLFTLGLGFGLSISFYRTWLGIEAVLNRHNEDFVGQGHSVSFSSHSLGLGIRSIHSFYFSKHFGLTANLGLSIFLSSDTYEKVDGNKEKKVNYSGILSVPRLFFDMNIGFVMRFSARNIR
ncbi:MAG: hypothetical protein AAF975_03295 [Spirochaetota bacterium]